jgi:hypothetical protein
MLPYRDSRVTQIVLGVFFVVLLGYTYFEAQGLLFGPTIDVSAPAEVYEPYVIISGKAERISSLSMNGQGLNVTESGSFSAPYLLAPGYNRIVLDAKDKYGRTRSQILQIVYVAPSSTLPALNATSTILSATSTANSTSTRTP